MIYLFLGIASYINYVHVLGISLYGSMGGNRDQCITQHSINQTTVFRNRNIMYDINVSIQDDLIKIDHVFHSSRWALPYGVVGGGKALVRNSFDGKMWLQSMLYMNMFFQEKLGDLFFQQTGWIACGKRLSINEISYALIFTISGGVIGHGISMFVGKCVDENMQFGCIGSLVLGGDESAVILQGMIRTQYNKGIECYISIGYLLDYKKDIDDNFISNDAIDYLATTLIINTPTPIDRKCRGSIADHDCTFISTIDTCSFSTQQIQDVVFPNKNILEDPAPPDCCDNIVHISLEPREYTCEEFLHLLNSHSQDPNVSISGICNQENHTKVLTSDIIELKLHPDQIVCISNIEFVCANNLSTLFGVYGSRNLNTNWNLVVKLHLNQVTISGNSIRDFTIIDNHMSNLCVVFNGITSDYKPIVSSTKDILVMGLNDTEFVSVFYLTKSSDDYLRNISGNVFEHIDMLLLDGEFVVQNIHIHDTSTRCHINTSVDIGGILLRTEKATKLLFTEEPIFVFEGEKSSLCVANLVIDYVDKEIDHIGKIKVISSTDGATIRFSNVEVKQDISIETEGCTRLYINDVGIGIIGKVLGQDYFGDASLNILMVGNTSTLQPLSRYDQNLMITGHRYINIPNSTHNLVANNNNSYSPNSTIHVYNSISIDNIQIFTFDNLDIVIESNINNVLAFTNCGQVLFEHVSFDRNGNIISVNSDADPYAYILSHDISNLDFINSKIKFRHKGQVLVNTRSDCDSNKDSGLFLSQCSFRDSIIESNTDKFYLFSGNINRQHLKIQSHSVLCDLESQGCLMLLDGPHECCVIEVLGLPINIQWQNNLNQLTFNLTLISEEQKIALHTIQDEDNLHQIYSQDGYDTTVLLLCNNIALESSINISHLYSVFMPLQNNINLLGPLTMGSITYVTDIPYSNKYITSDKSFVFSVSPTKKLFIGGGISIQSLRSYEINLMQESQLDLSDYSVNEDIGIMLQEYSKIYLGDEGEIVCIGSSIPSHMLSPHRLNLFICDELYMKDITIIDAPEVMFSNVGIFRNGKVKCFGHTKAFGNIHTSPRAWIDCSSINKVSFVSGILIYGQDPLLMFTHVPHKTYILDITAWNSKFLSSIPIVYDDSNIIIKMRHITYISLSSHFLYDDILMCDGSILDKEITLLIHGLCVTDKPISIHTKHNIICVEDEYGVVDKVASSCPLVLLSSTSRLSQPTLKNSTPTPNIFLLSGGKLSVSGEVSFVTESLHNIVMSGSEDLDAVLDLQKWNATTSTLNIKFERNRGAIRMNDQSIYLFTDSTSYLEEYTKGLHNMDIKLLFTNGLPDGSTIKTDKNNTIRFVFPYCNDYIWKDNLVTIRAHSLPIDRVHHEHGVSAPMFEIYDGELVFIGGQGHGTNYKHWFKDDIIVKFMCKKGCITIDQFYEQIKLITSQGQHVCRILSEGLYEYICIDPDITKPLLNQTSCVSSLLILLNNNIVLEKDQKIDLSNYNTDIKIVGNQNPVFNVLNHNIQIISNHDYRQQPSIWNVSKDQQPILYISNHGVVRSLEIESVNFVLEDRLLLDLQGSLDLFKLNNVHCLMDKHPFILVYPGTQSIIYLQNTTVVYSEEQNPVFIKVLCNEIPSMLKIYMSGEVIWPGYLCEFYGHMVNTTFSLYADLHQSSISTIYLLFNATGGGEICYNCSGLVSLIFPEVIQHKQDEYDCWHIKDISRKISQSAYVYRCYSNLERISSDKRFNVGSTNIIVFNNMSTSLNSTLPLYKDTYILLSGNCTINDGLSVVNLMNMEDAKIIFAKDREIPSFLRVRASHIKLGIVGKIILQDLHNMIDIGSDIESYILDLQQLISPHRLNVNVCSSGQIYLSTQRVQTIEASKLTATMSDVIASNVPVLIVSDTDKIIFETPIQFIGDKSSCWNIYGGDLCYPLLGHGSICINSEHKIDIITSSPSVQLLGGSLKLGSGICIYGSIDQEILFYLGDHATNLDIIDSRLYGDVTIDLCEVKNLSAVQINGAKIVSPMISDPSHIYYVSDGSELQKVLALGSDIRKEIVLNSNIISHTLSVVGDNRIWGKYSDTIVIPDNGWTILLKDKKDLSEEYNYTIYNDSSNEPMFVVEAPNTSLKIMGSVETNSFLLGKSTAHNICIDMSDTIAHGDTSIESQASGKLIYRNKKGEDICIYMVNDYNSFETAISSGFVEHILVLQDIVCDFNSSNILALFKKEIEIVGQLTASLTGGSLTMHTGSRNVLLSGCLDHIKLINTTLTLDKLNILIASMDGLCLYESSLCVKDTGLFFSSPKSTFVAVKPRVASLSLKQQNYITFENIEINSINGSICEEDYTLVLAEQYVGDLYIYIKGCNIINSNFVFSMFKLLQCVDINIHLYKETPSNRCISDISFDRYKDVLIFGEGIGNINVPDCVRYFSVWHDIMAHSKHTIQHGKLTYNICQIKLEEIIESLSDTSPITFIRSVCNGRLPSSVNIFGEKYIIGFETQKIQVGGREIQVGVCGEEEQSVDNTFLLKERLEIHNPFPNRASLSLLGGVHTKAGSDVQIEGYGLFDKLDFSGLKMCSNVHIILPPCVEVILPGQQKLFVISEQDTLNKVYKGNKILLLMDVNNPLEIRLEESNNCFLGTDYIINYDDTHHIRVNNNKVININNMIRLYMDANYSDHKVVFSGTINVQTHGIEIVSPKNSIINIVLESFVTNSFPLNIYINDQANLLVSKEDSICYLGGDIKIVSQLTNYNIATWLLTNDVIWTELIPTINSLNWSIKNGLSSNIVMQDQKSCGIFLSLPTYNVRHPIIYMQAPFCIGENMTLLLDNIDLVGQQDMLFKFQHTEHFKVIMDNVHSLTGNFILDVAHVYEKMQLTYKDSHTYQYLCFLNNVRIESLKKFLEESETEPQHGASKILIIGPGYNGLVDTSINLYQDLVITNKYVINTHHQNKSTLTVLINQPLNKYANITFSKEGAFVIHKEKASILCEFIKVWKKSSSPMIVIPEQFSGEVRFNHVDIIYNSNSNCCTNSLLMLMDKSNQDHKIYFDDINIQGSVDILLLTGESIDMEGRKISLWYNNINCINKASNVVLITMNSNKPMLLDIYVNNVSSSIYMLSYWGNPGVGEVNIEFGRAQESNKVFFNVCTKEPSYLLINSLFGHVLLSNTLQPIDNFWDSNFVFLSSTEYLKEPIWLNEKHQYMSVGGLRDESVVWKVGDTGTHTLHISADSVFPRGIPSVIVSLSTNLKSLFMLLGEGATLKLDTYMILDPTTTIAFLHGKNVFLDINDLILDDNNINISLDTEYCSVLFNEVKHIFVSGEVCLDVVASNTEIYLLDDICIHKPIWFNSIGKLHGITNSSMIEVSGEKQKLFIGIPKNESPSIMVRSNCLESIIIDQSYTFALTGNIIFDTPEDSYDIVVSDNDKSLLFDISQLNTGSMLRVQLNNFNCNIFSKTHKFKVVGHPEILCRELESSENVNILLTQNTEIQRSVCIPANKKVGINSQYIDGTWDGVHIQLFSDFASNNEVILTKNKYSTITVYPLIGTDVQINRIVTNTDIFCLLES